MRLAAVSAALVGACGGHGASHGSGAQCTEFSVTEPGAQGNVAPVWAGDSWAIARPGTYLRIDDAGAITSAPMPDLLGSLAYDGVELGYYVPSPAAHIALFPPGDVSTLHDSPAFSGMQAGNGSVAADPTGAPRIEAYYNATTYNFSEAFGWSDGTGSVGDQTATALTIASDGRATASLRRCHSISCGSTPPWTVVGSATFSASIATTDTSEPELVASPSTAIYRNASGSWKVAHDVATPITTPPVAWSGSAFVSFDQGAVQLLDADFQLAQTQPVDVPDTTLLGVGATVDRALLVFASASSSDVDYVQVCL